MFCFLEACCSIYLTLILKWFGLFFTTSSKLVHGSYIWICTLDILKLQLKQEYLPQPLPPLLLLVLCTLKLRAAPEFETFFFFSLNPLIFLQCQSSTLCGHDQDSAAGSSCQTLEPKPFAIASETQLTPQCTSYNPPSGPSTDFIYLQM